MSQIGCGMKVKGVGRHRGTDVGSTQTDVKKVIGFGIRNNHFAQDLDNIAERSHTSGRIYFRQASLHDVEMRCAHNKSQQHEYYKDHAHTCTHMYAIIFTHTFRHVDTYAHMLRHVHT